MNVLDTNVVIALFRADHPHHEPAWAWFREALADGEPFTVPDIVWVALTRVATSRRVFADPAPFATTWDFVDSMRQQPTYLAFMGTPRTLHEYERLATAARATGTLLTDVYIAATARSLGGTVVTFDRDFRKFDGVRVKELG